MATEMAKLFLIPSWLIAEQAEFVPFEQKAPGRQAPKKASKRITESEQVDSSLTDIGEVETVRAESDQTDSPEAETDVSDSDCAESEMPDFEEAEIESELSEDIDNRCQERKHDATDSAEPRTKRTWPEMECEGEEEHLELTRAQRGTADLMPLPNTLPPYWTPRLEPAASVKGNDNIPGESHKFAIGQEMFLLCDKSAGGRSTRKAHCTNDEHDDFEYRNITPEIYLVDERIVQSVITVNENGDEHEGRVNWYMIAPRPRKNGRRGNRLLAPEEMLMAVEYQVGEYVKYKPGRRPGDRFGMRKAKIEGAYVRDGKRLYWLSDFVEELVAWDAAGRPIKQGRWSVWKDTMERDILPAE